MNSFSMHKHISSTALSSSCFPVFSEKMYYNLVVRAERREFNRTEVQWQQMESREYNGYGTQYLRSDSSIYMK